MKKIRCILAVFVALTLTFALCACGGSTAAPAAQTETTESKPAESTPQTVESTPQEAESTTGEAESTAAVEEPAVEEPVIEVFPVEGDYSLFGMKYSGYLVDVTGQDMSSNLKLAEDGTGYMTMDEDSMDIASWELNDGIVSLAMADESSMKAVAKNGILEMDIYDDGSMVLYYAQENADISAYPLMSVEEVQAAISADVPDSRLYALWSGYAPEEGIHLKYEQTYELVDMITTYDVHGKGPLFYSTDTSVVNGYEGTHIKVVKDCDVYHLNPKTMEATFITSSDFLSDNALLLDRLYQTIWRHAKDKEYTEETREWNGASYTAEVFPGGDYSAETAFYFDDNNQLVCVIESLVEGTSYAESLKDVGEVRYAIQTLDTSVDESLFDFSAYTIIEQS